MIRLAVPDIRDEDIARMVEVVKSGQLVQGKAVEEFEAALVEFSGIPHCAAVSSGTSALHLALLALGIGPGDKVLVPAFTYPATANAVELVGGKVLLCDVDPQSYVVTPQAVEKVLASPEGRDIKAIMLVHEFGFPVEVKRIAELAASRGIKVIEDAACALGTVADGFHPGYYSDMACFSFHPRKAITTGEGGAMMSRNAELVTLSKRLRNHGTQPANGRMDFTEAGLNYRLTNFQAALGINQIARFAQELDSRKEMVKTYFARLAGNAQVELPQDNAGHSWQSFMVVIRGGARERVKAAMVDLGIEVNLGAHALNCLTYFQRKYGVDAASCPVSTMLYQDGLVLPLRSMLTPDELLFICDSLEKVVGP
ncbi:DegT/DnrJ/EryC1/StrS aminotransferase family protein [Polaromonas sp. JS666]|uniref:DegT/DnrJ/EryC1/StrS family aminotransferase n=1 Tax=Polaromonas sp. (strain JS666 / ATCC BAA-500) TaxID=296591 RepID=UPI0009454EA1|nr:DegT/DnrJ/EryC1/StrS aminotransferase family protein [Polaromonas sp. JS666]